MHLFLASDVTGKIMSALSWTFIHSLWQGLLLYVVTVIVLLLTEKSGAATRYNLLLLVFAAFLCSCTVTFIVEWNIDPAANPAIVFTPGYFAQVFTSNFYDLQQITKTVTAFLLANEQLIFTCWFVFFFFRMLKILLAIIYNRRISYRHVNEPASQWKRKCMLWCEQLGIYKKVRILESGYCRIPVVMGFLKPLILVPMGLLAGLQPEQAEAILLHELAHIRRNDYLLNFLQNIAEAIFFFNPAVNWVSSLLREERENCCDDIALSHTRNKADLAEALIYFKEYELNGSAFTTAFPGKKNLLLRRVNRIMGIGQKNTLLGTGEKIFLITGVVLLLATAMLAASGAVIKEPVQGPAPLVNRIAAPVQDRDLPATRKNKFTNARYLNENHSGVATVPPEKNEAIKKMANRTSDQQLSEKEMVEPEVIQAKKDQEAAMSDQINAKKDQEQTELSKQQAALDEQQAMKNKIQAEKDEQQAKMERQSSLKHKKEAEKKEMQHSIFNN